MIYACIGLAVGFFAGNLYTAMYIREVMQHACRANYLDGYTDAYEGNQIDHKMKDSGAKP